MVLPAQFFGHWQDGCKLRRRVLSGLHCPKDLGCRMGDVSFLAASLCLTDQVLCIDNVEVEV
jgi:hypothetical protein